MEAAEFKKKILPLSGKLFGFARLLLHDSVEAEDAVQEVFIKLWNLRQTLDEYNSIEAFAMKVIKNWCLDRIKAKKPVYMENYPVGNEQSSDYGNPHYLLERADQLKHFQQLMQTLPEQQRMIIQLRDVEGLEFEEIGEILDMSINALRVNLSRARNRIREELIKHNAYGYSSDKGTAGKIL